MDVINKIIMSPPTKKKLTQDVLGVVGFRRLHIPGYSLIVSPLCQVTQKKSPSLNGALSWKKPLNKLNRRHFLQYPLGQAKQKKM